MISILADVGLIFKITYVIMIRPNKQSNLKRNWVEFKREVTFASMKDSLFTSWWRVTLILGLSALKGSFSASWNQRKSCGWLKLLFQFSIDALIFLLFQPSCKGQYSKIWVFWSWVCVRKLILIPVKIKIMYAQWFFNFQTFYFYNLLESQALRSKNYPAMVAWR